MIEHIKEEIEKLVSSEKEKCISEKGLFVDNHQVYGVLKEEIQEMKTEFKYLKAHFKGFWDGTKHDDPSVTKINIDEIKDRAILLACEAIQVAAMAEKYIQSFKEE